MVKQRTHRGLFMTVDVEKLMTAGLMTERGSHRQAAPCCSGTSAILLHHGNEL